MFDFEVKLRKLWQDKDYDKLVDFLKQRGYSDISYEAGLVLKQKDNQMTALVLKAIRRNDE